MDKNSQTLTMRQQCRLLQINRSTCYYKTCRPVQEAELLNEVHEIWQANPFYGYRRIGAALKRRGHIINHKRAYRMMKDMNLEALYPKKNLSHRNPDHKVYPYLLRGMAITQVNQVWCTDITYIKMSKGFVYLVAIIDVYSRFVMSWRLSISLDTGFCLEMLEEALTKGCPTILNTDQGCQFTSQAWIDAVKKAGISVSMDGKGRWADNILIERFWRTIKYEDIWLNVYETVREVRQGVGQFIKFYNEQRPHQRLNDAYPVEVWKGQRNAPDFVFRRPVECVENEPVTVASGGQ